jgi:hypothetical protein
MTNHPFPRSPRAVTAIAAVLALSAIPVASAASAQEVQAAPPAATPSLSLPQDVTAGSPVQITPTTPTVTLPPEATAPTMAPSDTTTAGTTPAPATPQSVVLPETATAATPAEAQNPPERARTRSVARRTAPATVPTAQAAGTAVDGALAEGAVPPAAPAPARAEASPAPAAPAPAPVEQSGDLPVAGIAGLLAALGIAGLGIAAMRRRRNEPVYEEAEYAPVVTPEPVPEAVVVEPVPHSAAPVHAAPAGSASAVLAASPLPQTAEERRELLDRMVAASPDEANPFTAHKSRLRRARVQLQHEEATRPAGHFDFRTYRPSTQAAAGGTIPAKPDFVDA